MTTLQENTQLLKIWSADPLTPKDYKALINQQVAKNEEVIKMMAAEIGKDKQNA